MSNKVIIESIAIICDSIKSDKYITNKTSIDISDLISKLNEKSDVLNYKDIYNRFVKDVLCHLHEIRNIESLMSIENYQNFICSESSRNKYENYILKFIEKLEYYYYLLIAADGSAYGLRPRPPRP